MIIVRNKTYSVSPVKYGYVEKDDWVNGDKKVVVTTAWKGGTIDITPRTNEEVNLLTKAISNGSDDVFKPYDFTDAEFQASYDGYVEDTEVLGFSEEEELDGTIDEVYDGVDEEGIDYLEENGYYVDESEVSFLGELTIDEV
jgi:hypothetical protein